MKRAILHILIAAIVLLGVNGYTDGAVGFSATDIDGNRIELSDFLGKIVVLDFWATWCKPCIKEIPTLLDLYRRYKEKGFEIISISLDVDMAKARRYVSQKRMDWVHIIDRAVGYSIARGFGIEAIPAMFVIDKKGNIIAAGLRGEALKRKIAELLGR